MGPNAHAEILPSFAKRHNIKIERTKTIKICLGGQSSKLNVRLFGIFAQTDNVSQHRDLPCARKFFQWHRISRKHHILMLSLNVIRRDVVIVENELRQFLESRHDSEARERRARRLVELYQYHERGIVRWRETDIGIYDIMGVSSHFQIWNLGGSRLPGD